jgi:hypothetical protein
MKQRKQTKAVADVATTGTPPQPAAWVTGMLEHFQSTGFYRSEDLHRLLGDPRESVEVSVTPDLHFCARTK